MIVINPDCLTPVSCSLDHASHIAFDGCGFALPSPRGCGITKLDGSLCPIQTIPTTRKYTELCFDPHENCYWASAAGSPSILYKLDRQFCEIGSIRLRCPHTCRLSGISCDPCHDALLLLFPDSIAYADPCTGACRSATQCRSVALNLGIQALCEGYLLAYLKEDRQYIAACCPNCGIPAEFCIPQGYSYQAMFLRKLCHGEMHGCTRYEVGVLLRKRCDNTLTELRLTVSCCCGHTPPCPPVPPIPPCPPTPPCLPCACGKYEIMHSVALEEAGLAHILNAEGEKLQKAVAECTSIETLLKVNESVRRTITQITLLEGQLYSKLDALTDICEEDPCDPPHPPCPCESSPK